MKHDIKISIKKFTISLWTVLLFTVSVLSGRGDWAIVSGIEAAAIDITSENEIIDETICFDAEDYKWSSGLSSGVTCLYNENTFSFYDQLDDNNKSAYDAMKIWLEPTTEEFSVSLPDPVSYETSSTNMSSWDDDQKTEFWTIVLSTIRDGELALDYDYPELFWLDTSQISVTLSNVKNGYSFMTRKYTMTISELKLKGAVKEEYTDVETAAEFKQTYDNAVSSFEVKGDDNYSKIKYIHDSIANTVNYDLSAPYHDTALGFFIEPYSIVCEGYSKAVKILCDKENIPCIVVIGNVNTETNFAHMWNYIQMEDGNWYALDCTWDDLDDDSNPIKYQYFLKGSESFNTNHTPDTEYISTSFTYPQLSESDYVYSSDEPEITTSVTSTTVTESTSETETTVLSTSESVTQKSTSYTVTSVNTSVSETESYDITEITTISVVTTVNTATSTSVSSVSETVPETSSQETVIKGDFNCDKIVNVSDLVTLQKKLLGIIEINDYDFEAEMNDDGNLNIFDWIDLRRLIMKT
ncbi:transglutaminase domain-containing protein [Porcipelethomonas sp.]|uniref:transglutaminase domain-containing protein n=1 Tax=Porcipelethomonas sp. TaxID=2981675 RepID=UPI003EF7530A